jgi:hypothetical protein
MPNRCENVRVFIVDRAISSRKLGDRRLATATVRGKMAFRGSAGDDDGRDQVADSNCSYWNTWWIVSEIMRVGRGL